jgi:hypothetical protein
MKLFPNTSRWLSGLFIVALTLLSLRGAHAQLIWYNGDNDNVDNLFATASTGYSGFVYDDFNVTASGGWQVNGVSGNFWLPNTVSSANWSILTGVSTGNGGTVVQSGTSSSLTVTSEGITDAYNNTLYNVSVTGLNFSLAAGTYWLNLQPVSASYGYLATTSGANAIGTPAGDDGDAYYTETSLGGIPLDGKYFESTTSEYPDLNDFSLGVSGTAITPEPSSWALTLFGVGLLATYLRKRLGRI